MDAKVLNIELPTTFRLQSPKRKNPHSLPDEIKAMILPLRKFYYYNLVRIEPCVRDFPMAEAQRVEPPHATPRTPAIIQNYNNKIA
ncbi:MAG: hypothetical protein NC114_05005 [Ruminococcus flavefaciens]|nr:hypothetical protein [Ruminococcus flavefaciens]